MDLQDATNQYVDMLTLGSQALQRLAGRALDGEQTAELIGQLEKLIDVAEQLRSIASTLM